MLTCVIPARDATHCLQKAIDSVVEHVDNLLIYIDSRSDAVTIEEIVTNGVKSVTWRTLFAPPHQLQPSKWKLDDCNVGVVAFNFDDTTGFSGIYNGARDTADALFGKARWHLLLDADEVIDPSQAKNLRQICQDSEDIGVDAVGIPRYNWWDLERKNLRSEWFPDHQWRLLRPHVRFFNRVHSGIIGHTRNLPISEETLALHHFNLAYRKQEDWDKVNAEYARLLELDAKDGVQ